MKRYFINRYRGSVTLSSVGLTKKWISYINAICYCVDLIADNFASYFVNHLLSCRSYSNDEILNIYTNSKANFKLYYTTIIIENFLLIESHKERVIAIKKLKIISKCPVQIL